MKMLRAIGSGKLNIANSYDLRSVIELEKENKGKYRIHQSHNLSSSVHRIEEMSYAQFFNDLVKENSKSEKKIFEKGFNTEHLLKKQLENSPQKSNMRN